MAYTGNCLAFETGSIFLLTSIDWRKLRKQFSVFFHLADGDVFTNPGIFLPHFLNGQISVSRINGLFGFPTEYFDDSAVMSPFQGYRVGYYVFYNNSIPSGLKKLKEKINDKMDQH